MSMRSEISQWVKPMASFGLLFALASGYAALHGRWDFVGLGCGMLVATVLLGLLAMRLVPAPDTPAAIPASLQAICFIIGSIVIGATFVDGLVFHKQLSQGVPIWSDVRSWLITLGADWFGNGNYLANPMLYFVVPFVVLLLAGVNAGALGLRWGRGTVMTTAMWCALPFAIIASQVQAGTRDPASLSLQILSHSLQNGFMEEFLFRGVIQLAAFRFLPGPWAVVISAVGFGLWHMGLGFTMTGGSDPVLAIAVTVLFQSVIGLILGHMAYRTGSLIAPSIAHVTFNVAAGG